MDALRIVIADGYTLNPGDLSWDTIHSFGEVNYHDRTPADAMLSRCRHAHVIITNKAVVNAQLIQEAKDLKLICVTATGYNIVDVAAAKARGIIVSNVPDYGTASVAQHTFALILELANLVGKNSQAVAQGAWSASPDFCFSKGNLTELSQKTLGIVGMGRIGAQVARLANAFDMRVLYYNRSPRQSEVGRQVSLEELCAESDILSLHCPLTKDNAGMVNSALLATMKPSAWIINTSRGGLINEDDLAQALNDNSLAAAALDVLSVEPPPVSNPLLQARNCIITPHNAWMSFEARSRVLAVTEYNLKSFLSGTPVNRV